MARDHTAGGQVEPRAARLGELLRRWLSRQSVPGARQLHSRAVAPVVALQAKGQGTQGRDISALAPLRALRSRTRERGWNSPDPLHGNNTMFQIEPLTPSRVKRLGLVIAVGYRGGTRERRAMVVAGRPALLRSGFAQFGAQPFNVGGDPAP